MSLFEGAVDTAAVILDEDVGTPNEALPVVEQALGKHPHSAQLKRSLSRLYFHLERYPDQLKVGLPIVGAGTLGDVEQAYLHRELAVGLSHLGDHVEAARLFRAGVLHAGAVAIKGMTNMATGLVTDAGVQHVMAGDGPSALTAFAEALHAIDADRDSRELDDDALRRLFTHTVMWATRMLFPKATDEPTQEFAMIAGANSNPTKDKGLQSLPSVPIEVAWYYLADLEALLGLDLGITRAIVDSSWNDRAILTLEANRHMTRLQAAIAAADVGMLREALVGYIEADVLVRTVGHDAAFGQALDFRRGRLSALHDEVFGAVRGSYRKIPLAIFLRTAFEGNVDEACHFLQAVAAGPRTVFSSNEAELIRRVDVLTVDPVSDLGSTLHVAHALRTDTVPILRALVVVTVRLVENDADPYAGGVLVRAEERLLRWWRDALDQQAFRLRSPAQARAAFDAAVAPEAPSRIRLARVLLALNEFLDLRLSAPLRQEMAKLVAS